MYTHIHTHKYIILFIILCILIEHYLHIIIHLLYSGWGLVWKLLLSRFELLRAIFTDTDSNMKPSDKISSRHKRTKYQGSLVTTSSQPRRINNFKYN